MQNRSKSLVITSLLLFFLGIGLVGYGFYQHVNMSSKDSAALNTALMWSMNYPSPATAQLAGEMESQAKRHEQTRVLFFIGGGLLCALGAFCLVRGKKEKERKYE